MVSDFATELAGGKKTSVVFLDDIKDIPARLSDCAQRLLWVFDSNSAKLLSPLPANHIILPPGEEYKTWEAVEKIISAALDAKLGRDATFIGVGGGVICDITAFASSVFMRGCSLILVPTTLLCMVDASIGGKSAIDFKEGKNLIGTFYPAKEVFISTACLKTLSESEYSSGLGEVIKHAFLSEDKTLYNFLISKQEEIKAREKEALSEMVSLSLAVKAGYIERDPEEKKGIRQALNLGHTFAHALETISHFEMKHGLAVAWGLSRAAEVSVKMGLCESELQERIDSLLRLYGYDVDYRIEEGQWPDFSLAIGKDKKRLGGSVKFVLLEGEGKPVLKDVEREVVHSAVVKLH